MISNEIYSSDVVYLGGQILTVSDFQNKFPDWYETWNSFHKENDDEYISICDYNYGISATLNAFYKVDFRCRLWRNAYKKVFKEKHKVLRLRL